MDIKLDEEVSNIINQTYSIESSVIRELEQRRRIVETVNTSMSQTIQNSPTTIEAPVETDSTITNIENDLEYQYKLKEKELDSVLDSLAKLDIKIDKIDVEIERLDKSAIVLIDEINEQIDKVKAAYDFRVAAGCVSNLEWVEVGGPSFYYSRYGSSYDLTYYRVEKSESQKIETGYYGIKYYQKPLNRDYGFTVVLDFDGTIQVGVSSLAVLTTNAIENIQLADKIADNVDNPQAFGLGEFANVVGFGSTSILGVTTSIFGNVSTGSTVIALSGIGSTEFIKIGNYVINEDLFSDNTKVVGFGTTVTTISYVNPGISSIVIDQVIVPSIIIDTASIGIGTGAEIGFGTYISYPCLNLDLSSNLNLNNQIFTAIRMTEDVSKDFDYTKTPLDPVKIAIASSTRSGYGHNAVLVNNGFPSKAVNWNQSLGDKEPKVGNGAAVYYSGAASWPCIATPSYFGYTSYEYAVEGRTYSFTTGQTPIYTSVSPTGANPTGPACVSYASSVTAAEATLEGIKQRNLGRIQQLIAAANSLRSTRDGYELRAWGILQSASYTRMEMQKILDNLNAIRAVDYNAL